MANGNNDGSVDKNMKVTRSTCCDAPVLSTVEPIECRICNSAGIKTTTLMIYKCMACGQRCGVNEVEEDDDRRIRSDT